MPYVEYALSCGYNVVIAEAAERDIAVLAARGLHSVPRGTYEKMAARWQEYTPERHVADRVTVIKF
jgi:hypothetical protein